MTRATTLVFAVVAALVVATGSVGVAAQQRLEDELRAAELARWSAQIRRDTAALHAQLSDDLVYIHSNSLVESKSRFIESVAIGRIVYDSVVPVELAHRVYDDAAVGNGKVRVQVRMNDQTVKVDLIFTTVHVRRNGRWRLVAWQSTRAQ